MIKVLNILFLILLASCNTKNVPNDHDSKTIEIGNYQFDFPPDFDLVTEQGIDSYVGKIEGDNLILDFDIGYYSNSFAEAPQAYLDKGNWKMAAAYQFMEPDVSYDNNNYPEIEVLDIKAAAPIDSAFDKGADFIATCKHKETLFEFPIYLPDKTELLDFSIDTLGGHFRKIVIAKDPKVGRTGIYLLDLDSYDESLNSSLALSMSTGNLSKKQQELVLNIFKTGRPVKKK